MLREKKRANLSVEGRKQLSKQRIRTYLGISVVFLVSVIAVIYLPIDTAFKGIASIPAVGALVGALFQIFRDQAAFEKQLEIQNRDQFFNLAVTSHMASVAFDKHVEFCEKYMQGVDKALTTLFTEGPTPKVLNHRKSFLDLRNSYSAWLTKEILNGLVPFERGLSILGAKAHLVESLQDRSGKQHEKQRLEAIDEMFSLFREIVGTEQNEKIDSETYAKRELSKIILREQLGIDKESEIREYVYIESIKDKIRQILGIEELTRLRETVIQRAIQTTEQSPWRL